MRVGRVDVAAVDQCLYVLEAAVQADMWNQLNEQHRTHMRMEQWL